MTHGTMTRLIAAGLLACVGAAAHASSIDGAWQGVVRDGSQAVRTTVWRKAEAIRVHFGEPRNCAAAAELLEESGGSSHFRFKPASNGGGFCEALYPGDFVLTPEEQGVSIRFQRRGSTWSGTLSETANP